MINTRGTWSFFQDSRAEFFLGASSGNLQTNNNMIPTYLEANFFSFVLIFLVSFVNFFQFLFNLKKVQSKKSFSFFKSLSFFDNFSEMENINKRIVMRPSP